MPLRSNQRCCLPSSQSKPKLNACLSVFIYMLNNLSDVTDIAVGHIARCCRRRIAFSLLCCVVCLKRNGPVTDPPVHPDHLPTFTSWLFIVHFSGAPIVSAPCCYCTFTNACTFHPYVRQNPGTCTISSSGLAYYYRLCHCLQSISDKDSINCTVSGNMLILLQQSVLARW